MEISEKLKKIRAEKKWSQGKMGAALGISQQVYSNYENGVNQKYTTEMLAWIQDNFVDNKNTGLNLKHSHPIMNDVDIKKDLSIESLIESNRLLSESQKIAMENQRLALETNRDIAASNAQLAAALKSIANKPTEDLFQGLNEAFLTKLSQVVEFVAEVGSGKKYSNKDAALVELNKRYLGISPSKKEEGILDGADKKNK